jgi:hypothetical protein
MTTSIWAFACGVARAPRLPHRRQLPLGWLLQSAEILLIAAIAYSSAPRQQGWKR